MTTPNRISALIVAIALGLPASAQHAITPQQIATALDSAGMSTTPEQVVLLTDVVATTTAPALKFESAELWGDRRIKVRLSCVRQEECLPFFVAVQGSRAQPATSDATSTSTIQAKPSSNPPAIRAGGHATLLLEGDHIHIRLSVVCLESGAIGQTIRVTSLDRKLTYIAQVDGDRTLRGKLQ
jgi:hypothetical protein